MCKGVEENRASPYNLRGAPRVAACATRRAGKMRRARCETQPREAIVRIWVDERRVVGVPHGCPTHDCLRGCAGWLLRLTLLALLGGCGASLPPYDPARIHGRGAEATGEAGFAPELPVALLRGRASWYGANLHGRSTASGEPFDMYAFTAAHRRLPLGTVVRVTRVDDLRSVVVRINDRGPYTQGRIVDLSWAAAHELAMVRSGTAEVELHVLHWPAGATLRAAWAIGAGAG